MGQSRPRLQTCQPIPRARSSPLPWGKRTSPGIYQAFLRRGGGQEAVEGPIFSIFSILKTPQDGPQTIEIFENFELLASRDIGEGAQVSRDLFKGRFFRYFRFLGHQGRSGCIENIEKIESHRKKMFNGQDCALGDQYSNYRKVVKQDSITREVVPLTHSEIWAAKIVFPEFDKKIN